MKAKRTMSRFLCDNPTVERREFTQTCYADTGLVYRTDDDRDSGTESDDEGAEIEELQKYMETIIHLDSSHHRRTKRLPPPQVTKAPDPPKPHRPRRTPRWSPGPPDSALPSDSDPHHSSEEELEVINSISLHPELEVLSNGLHPELEVLSNGRNHELEVINRMVVGSHHQKRKWGGGGGGGLSADEEDNVLVCCPPVEFRTSPPAHVHRPGKCLRQEDIPPHELCSVVVSPRKRYRRTHAGGHHAVQRPCLDFEKMQQINRVRLL